MSSSFTGQLLAIIRKNPEFNKDGRASVAIQAALLGFLFGVGMLLAWYSSFWALGFYLIFLSFFHFTEFLCVAMFNPQTLTSDCK